MKDETGREAEQGSTALLEPRLQTLNQGKAAYGNILIFYMGEATKGEILMLILGGLHEEQAVQCGIWVPTQHLL
jgi:hypothetical protein